MAASFTSLTGRPRAAAKSNPTQPVPRFFGSRTGLPSTIGPGKPIETTSYDQSLVASSTSATNRWGVRSEPDGILRTSVCPGCQKLDVGSPNVNHKNIHDFAFYCCCCSSWPRIGTGRRTPSTSSTVT